MRSGLAFASLVLQLGSADLVVFDPDSIRRDATYLNPCVAQRGIEHVLVNGVPVVSEGKLTGAKPGRVLERQRRQ